VRSPFSTWACHPVIVSRQFDLTIWWWGGRNAINKKERNRKEREGKTTPETMRS
jgi:hypothetical protein